MNSTWRSLNKGEHDKPLGLCDFESVDPRSLVPASRVFEHRLSEPPQTVGEVYFLTYHATQRWYWMPQQTQEELFLMVMYDSNPGESAHCKAPN